MCLLVWVVMHVCFEIALLTFGVLSLSHFVSKINLPFPNKHGFHVLRVDLCTVWLIYIILNMQDCLVAYMSTQVSIGEINRSLISSIKPRQMFCTSLTSPKTSWLSTLFILHQSWSLHQPWDLSAHSFIKVRVWWASILALQFAKKIHLIFVHFVSCIC